MDDIQGQFMGLVKFTPTSWAQVHHILSKLSPAEIDHIDMTTLLNLLVTQGMTINTHAYDGFWGEIDSANDHELIQRQIETSCHT